MKVAIAVGDARRFVVGDPDIQLIDVLAGRLMDDLAAAEHHAEKGEIVLEPSAIERLGDRVALGELRARTTTPGVSTPSWQRLNVDPLRGHRSWSRRRCPRTSSGRGCCRPSTSGCGPAGASSWPSSGRRSRSSCASRASTTTTTTTPIGKLDEFVRGAQRVLNGYGGNVLQLTLGDKGAYLYGVFGSPLAHEDDAARAAAAALELRDLEKTTAARDIQIGITQGTLRSGTYGHEMRRTFVCLGDAVNLAARLMAAAPARADLRRASGPAGRRRRVHLGAPAGPARSRARRSRSRSGRSTARSSGRRAARPGSSSASSGAGRSSRARRRASPTRSQARAGSSASPPRPAWASRASSRSSCAPPGGADTSWPSASARRSARTPPTSSGARSGAACSASRTTTRRRPDRRTSRRSSPRIDPALVARAPAPRAPSSACRSRTPT